ncbi:hypothetical protein [Sphingomonas sp. KR3-1]|uniref:hypothetical protein n=1 Tax=Sphingomonas sp. KR3-1 TaxID=3156611 RepID=UPI0032B36CF1
MAETLGERRKQYIYALWYPAALGTFAYIGLTANPAAEITALPWQLPLIFYFSAQFLEGMMEPGETYPLSGFARDFVELFAMAATFHLLYPGEIKLLSFVKLEPHCAIALTLLIPPVYRFFFERGKLWGVQARRYWALTALSGGVAAATALAGLGWLPEWLAFTAMVVALVVYAIRFVFYPRSTGPAPQQASAGATPPEAPLTEPAPPPPPPVPAPEPEPVPQPAAEAKPD